jgi:hypothetical protein
MFIQNFPDDVVFDLLSEWFDLKNMVQLDSSATNRQERTNFLAVMSHQRLVNSVNKEVRADIDVLLWLYKKNIKLLSVQIHPNCFRDDQKQLIYEMNCSRIQSITIHQNASLEMAVNLVNNCPCLINVNLLEWFSPFTDTSTFYQRIDSSILRQLKTITGLTIVECRLLACQCRNLINLQSFYFQSEGCCEEDNEQLVALVQSNPHLAMIEFCDAINSALHARITQIAPCLSITCACQWDAEELAPILKCYRRLDRVVLSFQAVDLRKTIQSFKYDSVGRIFSVNFSACAGKRNTVGAILSGLTTFVSTLECRCWDALLLPNQLLLAVQLHTNLRVLRISGQVDETEMRAIGAHCQKQQPPRHLDVFWNEQCVNYNANETTIHHTHAFK